MWLVVAGGVEGEVAEEFAGVVVDDDGDVAVGDEHHDRGVCVSASDADVVESSVVADGDLSELVDVVVADPVVGVGVGAGLGFG